MQLRIVAERIHFVSSVTANVACPLTTLWWCVMAMMCRFVTHAGNARSFSLRSLDIIIVAASEAYAAFRVGDDS